MKIAILALFATLVTLSVPGASVGARSHAGVSAAVWPITGVWRCEIDGLPAIDLVISDEGGALSGAVLFYFHMRKTVNDPYTSTPGLPEPLFHLAFDGKTLSFEVSHRRAHPPRSLHDPPVHFRLTVTGPNTAEFENESEQQSIRIKFTRSDY